MSPEPKAYSDVRALIDDIQTITQGWDFPDPSMQPWYRGQKEAHAPLPGILREPRYNEFEITRTFRNRAESFDYRNLPETERLDKWLFLMQHYGSPTRLLDWSESLLVAIFVALMDADPTKDKDVQPTIWVLNPHGLNALSGVPGLPNTWTRNDVKDQATGQLLNTHPGIEHFRLAFHPQSDWCKPTINTDIVRLPLAVPTVTLDARMYAQQSCFTIWGIDSNDLCTIQDRVGDAARPFLYRFTLDGTWAARMFRDLRKLGMTFTSIYPDLEGFSRELKHRFSN